MNLLAMHIRSYCLRPAVDIYKKGSFYLVRYTLCFRDVPDY